MCLSYAQRYASRVPAIVSTVEVHHNLNPGNEECLEVDAVWDTGATKTFMSRTLADKLNIVPLDFETVLGATGKQEAGMIDLSIKLPNGLHIPDKRVYICALPGLVEMVIGMDIIRLGDFHISNAGGKTLFSFVSSSLPVAFNLAESARRFERDGGTEHGLVGEVL